MDEVIRITNLTKLYAANRALDGVSFDVRKGEIFGVVGPDGAGKTTLMRIVAGVLDKSAGSLTVLGLDMDTRREEIKRHTGYMSQKFNLYPTLTVQENIEFFAGIFGVSRAEHDERVPRLLELTGLSPFVRRQAKDLSGGMKQKLALIATLIHQPDILILDEPTVGVDPLSRTDFWQILQNFSSQGTTILISTSYMDEAELCNRILLLYNGKILLSGNPVDLKKTGTSVFELKPLGPAIEEATLRKLKEVSEEVFFKGTKLRVIVRNDRKEKFAEEFKAAAGITEVSPTIEDIFITAVSRR